MKKTLLLTLEFPPEGGGVARYLKNFCSGFAKDTLVVLAPEEKESESFDAGFEYPVLRAPLFYKKFRPAWIKMIMEASAAIKKCGIEKILVSHVLPAGEAALVLKCLKGISYDVIIHGLDIRLPQHSQWKTFWMKLILKNAEKIIANSEYTKTEAVRIGLPAEKITVRLPCLDPNDYPIPSDEAIASFKKEKGLENKAVLLTVGRLVERKGQDKVIEALSFMKKTHPDLFYVIAGTGPHEKKLRALAKEKNVEDRVLFFGRASNTELPLLFSTCDLFVMASRELEDGDVEGFGMVYLEANRYGKAVIAGQGGGVGEAVRDGETGIVIDGRNPKKIAETILDLLHNEEKRKRLGARGQARVEKYFLCK